METQPATPAAVWTHDCPCTDRPTVAWADSVDINPWRRPTTADLEVSLAYGDGLTRLRDLKRAVDPQNLFRAGWPLLPLAEHTEASRS